MPISERKYISVTEYAAQNNLSERTVRNYCANGKFSDAFLTGKTWNIAAEEPVPYRGTRVKKSALLQTLQEQRKSQMSGSIYHKTQIEFAYNSNHIEGSQLTHDQTRYIYETNTLGFDSDGVRVDDVVETMNHFRAFDYVSDHATEPLSEKFIQQLHFLLKSGTSDARKTWFKVGEYKQLANEVGGLDTIPPAEVEKEMKKLLREYHNLVHPSFDDLLDFHVRLERIHPFQDGNGRVGRLILFKECLCHGMVPFIISEDLKRFYYRGLQNWPEIPGYLRDTCLTAQDNYKLWMKKFGVGKVRIKSSKKIFRYNL